MQVSVENTSTLGRRLTIEIPAEVVKSAIDEKMTELWPKARLDGFRQGKVPKKVFEERFGSMLREEAVGKLIETSLPTAFQNYNLKPAGRPVVDNIQNAANQPLQFTVNFEVFPEFKLNPYQDIKLEKYVVEVTEKDVEKSLEKLQDQCGEWGDVSRKSKEGDRLIVDYASTINGKPYENNSGQDVEVILGSKVFLEGFEKGLLGVKKDQEVVLDLHFPKEWRMEKLAGKPVEFTVKVKSVQEKKPAEINEAFAKKIGASSADLKEIKLNILQNLEKQVAQWVEGRLKEQTTDALLKLNNFPIPKALVEREAENLHEDYHRKMGNKPEGTCQHQGLMEQAERRVALGLILNEVIKLENIKADETRVRARVKDMANMFGNAEFLESMYYESEELLSGVRHTVMLDQALELVLVKASITEKRKSMDALFQEKV